MSRPGRGYVTSVRVGVLLVLALCSSIGAFAAAAAPVAADPVDAPEASPTGDPEGGAPPAETSIAPSAEVDVLPPEDGGDVAPKADVGDAVFVAVGTALGGVVGLAVVGLTANAVIYSTANIVSIVGTYTYSQYWGWSFLGLIPMVISLAAIPIGGAFGMWWGAGLRGLPFPLVDALAHMGVGLLFGAAAGGFALTPVGLALGAMAMGGLLPFGRPPNPLQYQTPWLVPVGALVLVPLVGGVLPAAAFGMAMGGAGGPVLTAARWGLYAKSAYGTVEEGGATTLGVE